MGLVYSTETGRHCPDCGELKTECRCKTKTDTVPAGDGIVRVSRETKGRKGKGVTLVTGVPLAEKELKALAKTLKAKCGTGGTVKAGVIEIQGDQRDLLVAELQKQGYTVKKAGG
ncbi:translation initiation factor Sui1 [Saccharospirillum salsuginis]|uniref:Translation initiation factor n=1 Tax=Saccharospirillum salsuginis TaxID=418750 RepID=A0A918K5K1_9GAMM|nr:translation initiation factor Sui1 [Saccharospirillum salsuginis]GGX48080.1 translation initiation factor [Saccharospirillum salsuginis]